MTYRTGTARAAWRIAFMDTTLTLRTPFDALEQALGTHLDGSVITAKLLFCELARHGYLGEEADLIVRSAMQSRVLTPILDRQMRSAFVVAHARLGSLRGTVDGWRRTFRRGSPSVA
ncbi:MAG: hypothetical protein QM674_15270 [Burkholderiaceae bacterium]